MNKILAWLKEWSSLLLLTIFFASFGFLTTKTEAKSTEPNVECVDWASTEQWTVKKCIDMSDDTVCYIASSGMFWCKEN